MKTKILFTVLFVSGFINLFATNFEVSVYTDGAATVTNSLRWAITQANADATATPSAPHTITFIGTPSAISIIGTVLPTISRDLTINPTNVPVTINALTGNNILATSTGKTTIINYLTLQGASGKTTGALSLTGTVVLNYCTIQNNDISATASSFGGAISTASNLTSLTLNNCLLKINKAVNGGAISTYGNITLNDCTFQTNSAVTGGAIIQRGTSPITFNRCTFESNSTTAAAGNGAVLQSGVIYTLSFTSCLFNSNTGGPSIYMTGTGGHSLTVDKCVFTNNTNATTGIIYGGAINSYGVVTITNSKFSNNSANRGGAVVLMPGVLATKSKLNMSNCTLDANTASAYGGAIYIGGSASDFYSPSDLNNCTISGNTCTGAGGGGIQHSLANTHITVLTMTNCTVTGNINNGNTATSYGGGITTSGGTLRLNYSIVAGNDPNSTDATKSKDIYYPPYDPAFPANPYGKLGSTTGRNMYGATLTFNEVGAVTDGNVILTTEPISSILNTTLADNGGSVSLPSAAAIGVSGVNLTGGGYLKTHALMSGSSAINPTSVSGFQSYDQRGKTRDLTPDMGAYELIIPVAATTLQNSTPTNNSFTLSWTASSTSGAMYEIYKDGISIGTVAAGVLTYDVTGLSANTTYSMTVKSILDGVYSDASQSLNVKTDMGTAINDVSTNAKIYVNALNDIVLDLNEKTGSYTVSVYDLNGNALIQRQVQGGSKSSISNSLCKGVYIIRIDCTDNTITTKIFIK